MKRRNSKKTLIIIIAAVIVVALAIPAFFLIRNYRYVKLISDALKYSGKTSESSEQNEQRMNELKDKLTDSPIGSLTKEQLEMLERGELTEQDAIDIILGRYKGDKDPTQGTTDPTSGTTEPSQGTAEPDPGTTSGSSGSTSGSSGSTSGSSGSTSGSGTSAAVDPVKQERINELVANVYVVRDSFSKRIDDTLEAARAEYKAIPSSQRNTAALKGLLDKYGKIADELETECDRKMDEILDELEVLIAETGGDKSLVSQVAYAYATEKSIKKAYYIDLYKNKLLGKGD